MSKASERFDKTVEYVPDAGYLYSPIASKYDIVFRFNNKIEGVSQRFLNNLFANES